MEFHAGYLDGQRTVHLTVRSFLLEALCGEAIALDGEPALAVICDDCHAQALQSGGDPEAWLVEFTAVEVRPAA